MDHLFVTAFGLGIAFSAPPGAVTAEAIRRGFARGFRAILLVELGSLIGDAVWAAIGLTGAGALMAYAPVRVLLGVIGGGVILRLALAALADAWGGSLLGRVPASSSYGDLTVGALISLTNPYAVAFWLGIGGALSFTGLARPTLSDFGTFFAGFMIAALSWCFLLSAVVGYARSVVKRIIFRVINVLCGLTLLFFGIRLLVSVWQSL